MVVWCGLSSESGIRTLCGGQNVELNIKAWDGVNNESAASFAIHALVITLPPLSLYNTKY